MIIDTWCNVCNARSNHYEICGTCLLNLRDKIKQLQEHAQEVARLLELGDQRLLAGDGPCGGQNAAVALSPEESAKLYQACKKIAAEAAGVSNG